MKDYEQLYYDSQYEIKTLKNKINFLEEEIRELNLCRTNKNINLQRYLIYEIKKFKEEN